jgi:hypothetical protein
MNNEEAKFILRAYRPGGRDADDATFSGALTQARRDPALGSWFAREQAHDTAVAEKLGGIAPPAGLREAILAGGKVSRLQSERRRRRRPAGLALAASVLVLLSLAGVWQGRRVSAARERYAEFAVNDALHGHHEMARGAVMGALVARLGSAAQKLPGKLAFDEAQLKAQGCRTLRFAGHDVLEVCFARDGTMYHLYVLPRAALPDALLPSSPRLLAMNGPAVATWTDGKHEFAVVSPAGMAALERLTG